jgi:phosphoesterase RecJ-like protein
LLSQNNTELAHQSINISFQQECLDALAELLRTAGKIVITTHHRPDGDAMGSSLALYNFLKNSGCDATVVTPSDYPDFLFWLPGHPSVVNFESNPELSGKLFEAADLIFCLDFNSFSRVEKMSQLLEKSKAKKILIDHHLHPDDKFAVAFSYTSAASTAEIVYDLILALGKRDLIDKNIAECIYCGIMTDTNSFRYSNMKAGTHRIVADLIDLGAENYKIHERVYDNSTESRMRLLGYSLYEKLIVLPEYNTAYISLTQEEVSRFDFKSGDTEGLVNYALGISGIIMGVFFHERDGGVKISFRSKGSFSVQELSSKYFGGGGHKNASGGFSNAPINDVIKKFLEILPLYKTELKSYENI